MTENQYKYVLFTRKIHLFVKKTLIFLRVSCKKFKFAA